MIIQLFIFALFFIGVWYIFYRKKTEIAGLDVYPSRYIFISSRSYRSLFLSAYAAI